MYCFIVLAGDFRLLATKRERVQQLAGQNATLMVTHLGGVDMFGKPYFPEPSEYRTGFVLFVLRGASLDADVAFWRKVAAAIPSGRRKLICLIAYCDGLGCSRSARAMTPLPFRVVTFAAVNDQQAMINADASGQCLVLLRNEAPPPPIRWRDGRMMPARTAEEIIDELHSAAKAAPGNRRLRAKLNML